MAQGGSAVVSSFEKEEAVDPTKPTKPNTEYCKGYYQSQTKHTLGKSTDRLSVPIWIATNNSSGADSEAKPNFKNVHEDWIDHLNNAIDEINLAAPGLHLYRVHSEKDNHKIGIYGIEEKIAYTGKNIVSANRANIYLGDRWSRDRMKRTSVHEIFHALGFGHEVQASDPAFRIDIPADEKDSRKLAQFSPYPRAKRLTRFDPFSIMLYSESDKLKRRPEGDSVWNLKPTNEPNMKMSELDKLGLNIIYKPCEHDCYQPKISPVTGLYYCGRKVMTQHNYPWENTTDGFCGPTNWANCPACRVLTTERMKEIFMEDKWQGWSGLVYCGKQFGVQAEGHDGYCGPDNGPSCPDCSNVLNPV